jgi:pimeloyl-ACP methyl ester carboxylesterase
MGAETEATVVRSLDERTRFLQVNGLRLLCREWGRVEAPPLVLLHGLRGFSGTWRGLASELCDRYRLIAFDQRGRGESDWDPQRNYYTDTYLADLEGVVDQLRLERFVLLGHSMGGTTSYVYSVRHPERLAALVIEDIAPGSSVSGAGAQRIVSEMQTMPAGFASWAAARQYWRTLRPSLSAAAIEQRISESLRAEASGRIVWRYDAEGIRQTRVSPDPSRIVDLWPVVEQIKTPTLIIRGELSDFCPAVTVARMRTLNPHIQAVSIGGAGHYVHDDAPGEFVAHVRAFLMRMTDASGARYGRRE